MSWFWIAIAAPFLYAVTNHTDKFLLEKYLKNRGIGSLMIFSSLFSVVALPVIGFICWHDIITATAWQCLLLGLGGICVTMSFYFYLRALDIGEASAVVPFFQLDPIFAYLLGRAILGETLTEQQWMTVLVLLSGAFILSFEKPDGGRWTFKRNIVVMMVLAALCVSGESVIFKKVGLDIGFWPAAFWFFVGKVLVGGALFVGVRSYRQEFLTVLRTNSWRIIGLNAGNETVYIIAESLFGYAILLAPLALVLSVNSLHPAMALLIGIVLTRWFPHLGKETLHRRHLTQKIIGITLLGLGTILAAHDAR
jgi:drug/metabolite transporter (DMT)-like permease